LQLFTIYFVFFSGVNLFNPAGKCFLSQSDLPKKYDT
jgi:hypothetical protein